MVQPMEHADDIAEWKEATRLEAEGDPSALAALLVIRAPLVMQERVAAVLRKLPRQKPPSARVINLADAVVYFEKHEGTTPYNALMKDTCARFNIKRASILTHALRDNRRDVNDELRRRGLKES